VLRSPLSALIVRLLRWSSDWWVDGIITSFVVAKNYQEHIVLEGRDDVILPT
jgi:hypothetical protein